MLSTSNELVFYTLITLFDGPVDLRGARASALASLKRLFLVPLLGWRSYTMSKAVTGSASVANELKAGEGIVTTVDDEFFVIEVVAYVQSASEQAVQVGIHSVEEMDDIPGRYKSVEHRDPAYIALPIPEFEQMMADSTGQHMIRPLYGVKRINDSNHPALFDMKL